VTRAGSVLLDHEFAVGPGFPGSLGPAGSGGHRALGTVLIVDPAWDPAGASGEASTPPQDDPGIAFAVMRLSGPAVLIAVCADGLALVHALDRALQAVLG
jgi:urease accessory protein